LSAVGPFCEEPDTSSALIDKPSLFHQGVARRFVEVGAPRIEPSGSQQIPPHSEPVRHGSSGMVYVKKERADIIKRPEDACAARRVLFNLIGSMGSIPSPARRSISQAAGKYLAIRTAKTLN